MAVITINAGKSNSYTTVTLDSTTDKKTATISGMESSLIVGKNNIIAEYEAIGYSYVGEVDCTLSFQKEEVTCDYDAKRTEINDYLDQGYEITSEQNCQVVLEKVGEPQVVISLDSTVEITENITVNGDYKGEVTDEVIVEGTEVTLPNEQEVLAEGFTYEGVIDGKKTWSKEIEFFEFDNKLQTIADYQALGYTFEGEVDGVLKFTGTFEQCEILDRLKVIADHQKEGYELVREEDCSLFFQRSIKTISSETDVYAFFDTTSMKFEDGKTASKTLKDWFADYQTNHPDYEGNLYIIPVYYERYVDYLDIIKKGNAVGKDISGNVSTSNAASSNRQGQAEWKQGLSEVAIYPPNFDAVTTNSVNSAWTPPTDVLMLAFVDEANGAGYHSRTVSLSSQPTEHYIDDYNRFQANKGDFKFFKAVLYPIVRALNGEGGALVLQSLAAIEGKLLSDSEIASTRTKVDVSELKTNNPYTAYQPLKELGWIGVYDKTSPASDVFTDSGFATELNEVIASGTSNNNQVEEKIVEGTTKEVTKEETVEGVTKKVKEYVYQEGCEIKIGDPEYFKDASFTVAYSTLMGAWISYYSFVPNYYVNHNDFFQTGLNEGVGGLWDHLKTNKNFQTFYGEVHPWILEVPVKEQMVNRTMKDIEYYIDAKEYSGEYDYAEVRNRGFNKAWVYNNRVNTGELNLKPSTGLMSDLSNYPNTISQTQQEILYSDLRGKHRFNYFYDRVKDDRSNKPMWLWDINQIHRTLNPEAISFTGKSSLDQIKGDWFSVRFQQDERTDTRFEFKWMTTSETIKP